MIMWKISSDVLPYYKNLFVDPIYGCGGLEGEDVILSLVSLEENAALTAVPLVEKIKQVVFRMDHNSALSPFDEDVAAAVCYFFFFMVRLCMV